MPSDAVVQQLIDRQQISELIYRYCRAVDRIDVALGHTIWHADGVADYGAEVYQGDGRGVMDFICMQHEHALAHSHQVTNILIELNGDRAASESYATATLRLKRDGRLLQMTMWARYLDQWSKREGRWGLDKRISLRDFDEVREVTAIYEHARGRRDRSDPSYAVFAGAAADASPS